MKTLTTTLFNYSELSPDAQTRALDTMRNRVQSDDYILEHTGGEIVDSLKSITAAMGLRLRNYSFGAYDRSHDVTVDTSFDDECGPRALARVLRVLISHGYTRPKRFEEMTFHGICGFTGVCFDDSVVDNIWSSLLDGDTIREAFSNLSGKLNQIMEDELDYLTSNEAILERIDEEGDIFTEEGDIY